MIISKYVIQHVFTVFPKNMFYNIKIGRFASGASKEKAAAKRPPQEEPQERL